MNKFGEVLRDLRVAQDLGLRETAVKVGISPAYLSRIERNKEKPPSAEVIKSLAKALAADPDVLFRLSSSTDPELAELINDQPELSQLLRTIKELKLTAKEIERLSEYAFTMKS
jgi:HTH-type transcriptional regulator, competence development regulator